MTLYLTFLWLSNWLLDLSMWFDKQAERLKRRWVIDHIMAEHDE